MAETANFVLPARGIVVDATIVQGETWELNLLWSTTTDGTTATPVNITGYTARMMIRQGYESSTPLISLTDTAGIALGGSAGTIKATLTSTQTAGLTAGKCVYDLELVSPAGVVTNIARGTLTIIRNVTR